MVRMLYSLCCLAAAPAALEVGQTQADPLLVAEAGGAELRPTENHGKANDVRHMWPVLKERQVTTLAAQSRDDRIPAGSPS
jgi:hypothetical protein